MATRAEATIRFGFTIADPCAGFRWPSLPPERPQSRRAEANKALLWWWGSAHASSYNVKRSTSLNGPLHADRHRRGQRHPAVADSGLTGGPDVHLRGLRRGEWQGDQRQRPGERHGQPAVTGTVIGSDGAFTYGQWKDQLFDNAPITFYDAAHPTGDWAGLDLGAP